MDVAQTAAGKDRSPHFEIAGAVEAFGDESATDFGCILGSYSLPGRIWLRFRENAGKPLRTRILFGPRPSEVHCFM
jgi:hypothetical protein